MKKNMDKILEIECPYDLVIILHGIYPNDSKTNQKNIFALVCSL